MLVKEIVLSLCSKSNCMKKIYRSVIRYEILSDSPINSMNLSQISEETTTGDLSGQFLEDEVTSVPVSGLEAVNLIIGQGSSPEFFGMNELGEELTEDTECLEDNELDNN